MKFLLLSVLGGFGFISSKKRSKTNSTYLPPLGLLYLGKMLIDAGHSVNILDFYTKEELEHALNSTDAIGISVSTPFYQDAIKLTNIIKQQKPDIPLIIGGPHSSFHPTKSLEDIPSADISISGEGELVIVDLANAIAGKKELSKIPGVSYRKNNKIVSGKPPQIIKDLDAIPFPARSLVEKYEYGKIKNNYFYKPKFASMITSRGCPFNCRFCSKHVLMYENFRQRSAENVIAEIQEISEKYRSLMMVDDNFLTDKKRNNKIFDELIKMKLDIDIIIPTTRVDTANRELYQKMKKAGVKFLGFGIESGNQQILDYYNKQVTIPQIEKAVKLSQEMNFITYASFIFGAPYETKEQIEKTIRFACTLPLDISIFHPLYYLFGSDLWNEAAMEGKITAGDGYGFQAVNERGLNQFSGEELDQFCIKAFRKFYFRPSYIAKQFYRSCIRKDFNIMKIGFNNVFS